MRTIYLIRHGKPEFPDERKYCIGQTDLPLSNEGKEQIRALLPRFEVGTIRKIYTSPLKRCRETAQMLSGGRIPVEVADGLKEIHMGSWDGLPFEEIRRRFPEAYRARGEDIYHFCTPNGESFEACARRAVRTWRQILLESEGDILIVGHAGWFRALLCELEKRNPRELLKIPFSYAQVYERREYRFDALISAAGRSSRMGDFKPLMELGGTSVLAHEIASLRACGVHEITIITGRQAKDVQAAVAGPGIRFLHNADYETTQMFDSVCMGISYYIEKKSRPEGADLDGIFFFPVDVPLFTEFTLKYEMYRFASGDGDVYIPEYDGVLGHPLLIRAQVLKKLLKHDGKQGLKGACGQPGIRREYLEVPDPGCICDADTQEEFQKLREWERARKVPDPEWCESLLSWFHTPQATVRHCREVARLARELAEEWNGGEKAADGFGKQELDIEKIYAAALLHDIAKAWPEHPKTGAEWLRLLGHTGVAEIVADHMDLPEEKLVVVNESLIVYLADKKVQGERRVSVEERFAAKREKWKDNPQALAGVKRRYRLAKRAEACLEAEKQMQGNVTEREGRSDETDKNNGGSRTGSLS